MDTPKTLGEEVAAVLAARQLSALAASLSAGLSRNQVRNIVAGRHQPTAQTLAKLCAALSLDAATSSRLRRLAGIESSPGDSPEARATRRAEWQRLLWVAANHIWLPLRQLDPPPIGRGPGRKLIDDALACPSPGEFKPDRTKPPPAILDILDREFGDASRDDLSLIAGDISPGAGQPTSLRGRVARVLLPHATPARSLAEVYLDLEMRPFDRSFAIALFPVLYHEVCRRWPFEKAVLGYADRSVAVQRRIYDAINAGLSIEELCEWLLGNGEVGAELAAAPRTRPRDVGELPKLNRAQDAIFDHLTRCEFLERFPILKIDRNTALALARAAEHPLWAARVAALRNIVERRPDRYRELPTELTALRFASPMARWGEHDKGTRLVGALESYIARCAATTVATAAATRLASGEWERVADALHLLTSSPKHPPEPAYRRMADWVDLIRSLGAVRPAALDSPSNP